MLLDSITLIFVSMEPNELKMASHAQRNEYMRTNRMLDELGGGDRISRRDDKNSRGRSRVIDAPNRSIFQLSDLLYCLVSYGSFAV